MFKRFHPKHSFGSGLGLYLVSENMKTVDGDVTYKPLDDELYIASDGKEAIEILESMPADPDLILLDINMPRMNGHEFLKVFTKDNTRTIPVVVMLTSSDQKQDKEQAFEYKCVKDYLLKPISEDDVIAIEKLVAEAA